MFYCHINKTVIDDYGFKFLKIVKIIIINYGFRLKVKIIVDDYFFEND